MIRSEELKDWAEAARLIGITRARMTQIANLLLLAPEIQATILELHRSSSHSDQITEPRFRQLSHQVDWIRQVQVPLRPYRPE